MKKLIASILFSHLFLVFSFGQSHRDRVKVEMMSGKSLKGWLVHLDSNSITISKGWTKKAFRKRTNVREISVENIFEIKVKGKPRIISGTVVGTAFGFYTGSVVGWLVDGKICLSNPCEPPSKKQKRITIGITIIGSGLGAFGGSKIRKTNVVFEINGSKEALQFYKPQLEILSESQIGNH